MTKKEIYNYVKYIIFSNDNKTDEEVKQNVQFFIDYLKQQGNDINHTTILVLNKIKDNIRTIRNSQAILKETDMYSTIIKGWEKEILLEEKRNKTVTVPVPSNEYVQQEECTTRRVKRC